jgi:hypothetical protein
MIRDTIYLDGGLSYWTSWVAASSSWSPAAGDDNLDGLVLSLNLGASVGPQVDVARLLTNRTHTLAPGGQGITAYPNYVDGAMLASNSSFYLYGGVATVREAQDTAPSNDSIAYFERTQYGVERDTRDNSWSMRRLPEDISNYVAWGGSANAPSETKSWYFSGLKSSTDAALTRDALTEEAAEDESYLPSVESEWLTTLDATRQTDPQWSQERIGIEARASPEVVWVPVGEQGILVVLGGVVYPHWATYYQTSSANATESVSII